jgi:hypothetical protein
MYGPLERGLRSWMARAISSLPVPVSPTMRTQAREGATWRVVRTTSRKPALQPIMPGSVKLSPNRFAGAPGTDLESRGMAAHPSRIVR